MGEELEGFHSTGGFYGLIEGFLYMGHSFLQFQCQVPVTHATATIKRG